LLAKLLLLLGMRRLWSALRKLLLRRLGASSSRSSSGNSRSRGRRQCLTWGMLRCSCRLWLQQGQGRRQHVLQQLLPLMVLAALLVVLVLQLQRMRVCLQHRAGRARRA
jgi:hypothetical protein